MNPRASVSAPVQVIGYDGEQWTVIETTEPGTDNPVDPAFEITAEDDDLD